MSRVRVLAHLNSLELGGTQLNAVDFARALRSHGIETVLVGSRGDLPPGPSLLDHARRHGVDVRVYDAAPSLPTHARQLASLARQHRADLVHAYGMWGAARAVYWGPSLLGRRPWVHTVYEMSVADVVHRHVPLVVGTGYLVDELAERPGATVLVSPPVDLLEDRPDAPGAVEFRALHGGDAEVLLVVVSRLEHGMKAPAVAAAIEAMRRLARHGADLVVVGDGDAAPELRASAAAVNAEVGRDAVRLVGALADPRPAYAAADVVLGMGGSAARALAFGRPLVVQGEAGFARLFDEDSAAQMARNSYWSPEIVVDPAAALVRELLPLLDDAARRVRLGTFGRAFAQERFGLEAMAARLAGVYRAALGRDYGPRQWCQDLPAELGRLGGSVVRRLARVTRRPAAEPVPVGGGPA